MASPDYSDGCMIALYPSPELAEQLAVEGGLPADELHVTVAYVGNAADVDGDALREAVVELAARRPFAAQLAGMARFTGGDKDILVALVDSPHLEDLRRDTLDMLYDRGIHIPRDHGYTAHCSLTYLEPDEAAPLDRLAPRQVDFTALSAVHGTDRTDNPLEHPIAGPAREAFAAGWAVSGGPLTDRVRTGCTAAIRLAAEHADDPHILEVTLNLGKLEGLWALLFARREQLTAQHIKTITKAWRAAVSRDLLTAAVRAVQRRHAPRESDDPTRDDIAAATAAVAAVLASLPNRPEWTALRQAMRDALAAGRAEGTAGAAAIAADEAGDGPPEWDTAFQDAYDALNTDHTLWAEADTWLKRLLDRASTDLGRALADQEANGATEDDMIDAADGEFDGEDEGVSSVDFTVDWAVGTSLADGALAWYRQQGEVLVSWVTAGGPNVCQTCIDNESGSPYPIDQFPQIPAHPLCRCIGTTT
ncbi:2'-5' RNA ligase family protein [Streptomyces violascens]|uniref:2'-5' RNA ligase family protein n=1 Tax=Streptomyces violascens TaxID=67381 RepID=UPI0036B0C971